MIEQDSFFVPSYHVKAKKGMQTRLRFPFNYSPNFNVIILVNKIE